MKFEKVGEGIYKANDTISTEDRKYLYDFIYTNTNNPVPDEVLVPWEVDPQNVIYYVDPQYTDRKLLDIINDYKVKMAAELKEIHKVDIYPHLTTLVLWKPGQKMPRHVDDGAKSEAHRENLKMRHFTSVSYINDDYEGGETYIRSDGKEEPDYRLSHQLHFPNEEFSDYISRPEAGATLLFGADDKNAHGVLPVESGTRVILSTWFTTSTDPMHHEPLR
jgi:hypothetical protein